MKPFWKSKTFWFNVFGGLTTVAEVLPPHYAALVMALGNLGLRFVTKEAIHVLPQ